jgi:hypothetical protein
MRPLIRGAQCLGGSDDDLRVGIGKIGDRACLDDRRHPQRGNLIEGSPAAGPTRCHGTFEQRGAGRLVDAQEVGED